MLMSVLILAAVTSVVLSLAAISINEIRTSGDLLKTEPSITGAEALAEQALFKSVRALGTIDCNSTQTLTNNTLADACADYYLINPYTFNVAADSRRDFYMYNPVDQSADPQYTSFSLAMNSGSTATIYFCDFEVADCLDGPYIATAGLTPGGSGFSLASLNPGTKYQFVVASGANGANFTATTTDVGLPAGTTTIKSKGRKDNTTRKIETTLPQ